MRKMMTDQQYQALLARSGGSNNVSPQLLLGQSQPHGGQYLSRKLYGDRQVATDPYLAAPGSALVVPSSAHYTAANRPESYPDSQDIRAQLTAERRSLLPSAALIDYPSAAYGDHVGPRAISGTRISPEVAGAYAGSYPSPQGGSGVLSNAPMGTSSDLLARARRSELAPPYPSGYGNGVRRLAPPSAYDEQSMLPGQAAGILGPGGARRGRDLDRYLLAVQPEKLVRYAASCLAPGPALRRSGGYSIVGNNVNADDDMYSNYRRAKARRIGSNEFYGSPPEPRKYREREPYREKENQRERKRDDSSRDRGKRSPPRRSKNGSVSKGHDANRVGRPINSPQSSEGRDGHRNGAQHKRSRPSATSVRAPDQPEQAAEAKQKEDNDLESDKDSELGSLCADFSNSEDENVKKSEAAATVIDSPLAGMIFGCSSATFHECMKLQLFGLPAKNKDDVMRVTPGTKVFLFNFDTKELSGIFAAISHGGWQIQPDAFREFGGFPAQVQVCCSEQCPNLSQSVFRPAIKENYVNQTRFRFDLNTKQVKDLVRLFRQAARDRPAQQDNLEDRYLSVRLQSEDYAGRGGLQQRPYSRHHQARFGQSRVSYARVISMSAKTNVRQSKRASKRALKRRKKRKVSNRPESPMADNCILNSLSGEMQEADVTISTSKCCECDDTSNTNHAVIVRGGIETGNSRNVAHHKEILETIGYTAPKGTDPSCPDNRLSPSKAEEFPQLQSDLGRQVSFVEDSYNDGNFRLAGGRADEQGQGEGPDVLQGPLSICGNVIMSSESALSSIGEGLCQEVQRVLRAVDQADPLVALGGDEAQQLISGTDGDDHVSELDEKSNRQVSGDIGVPVHDNNNDDLDACESIVIHVGTDGKLPDVQSNEVLVENVEDDAECEPPHAGSNVLIVTGEVGTKMMFATEALYTELLTTTDGEDVVMVHEDDKEVILAADIASELLAFPDVEDVVKVHDDKCEEMILAVDTVESEPLASIKEADVVKVHDNQEVILAADTADSRLLASTDGEGVLKFRDDEDQSEEVIHAMKVLDDEDDEVAILAADTVDREVLSPGNMRGLNDDGEEGKVIIADALDSELGRCGDEDEDQVLNSPSGDDADNEEIVELSVEEELSNADDELEDEEIVEVSVDGELSNVVEDKDEDE